MHINLKMTITATKEFCIALVTFIVYRTYME